MFSENEMETNFDVLTQRAITLHVGLPKTATTTIQNALFANAELLKSHYGIDYCKDLCGLADVNCTGHHPLAWAEFLPTHSHFKPIDTALVKARFKVPGNILLSSEWFSMATTKQLSITLEKWDLPSDRRVLLIYRNEFDHIRSSWLQAIKMGLCFLSLQEYYLQRYKPWRSPISMKVKKWADLGFAVEVMSFDELKTAENDMTLEILNKLYGIKVDKKLWVNVEASNVSPPRVAVNLYRKLITLVKRFYPSLTSNWSEAEYHVAHDKLCRVLAWLPLKDRRYDEEEANVRHDLEMQPHFYDYQKDSVK